MSRKEFTIKSPLRDSGDLALSALDPWQDGLTYNPYPLETASLGLAFNGTNWDRVRNNTQGTLLASAARTTTTVTPTQTNYNAKGVLLALNVTVASGTGGLTLYVYTNDPVSGTGGTLAYSPVAVTASGIYLLELYPGIQASGGTGVGSSLKTAVSGALPRTWYVQVFASDASSYTYSLGYELIL